MESVPAKFSSWGSSKSRAPKKNRYFDSGKQRQLLDYFIADFEYDEKESERQYRMSRSFFDKVYARISEKPFFVRMKNSLKKWGLHPLQRIGATLCIMAFGFAADSVDDYWCISESAALESLIEFFSAFIDYFCDDYLRDPTPADMERILRISTARGFPGMAGSNDFQHYTWKTCSTVMDVK